ncbi:MAG: hypothetical protein H7320_16945 [Ferruginibacter sp.]|nr:hypothetical protein [Ferruginibacter sp.]
MQKNTAVNNIQELRYKLAEKFAALENDEISIGQAKAFTGLAMAIVKTCQIEAFNNESIGVQTSIDFLGIKQIANKSN